MNNASAPTGKRKLWGPFRRLRRDNKGVAAVEFALILPLMITLYLGSTQITQGILASRKMAIVARTLADLVAQQPTAVTSPCTTAGICDTTMTNIFGAASVIMSPFSTGFMTDGSTRTLTMAVSSVDFTTYSTAPATAAAKAATWVPSQNQLATGFTPTSTDQGFEAKVKWSKAAASPNDEPVRSCATSLTPAENSASPSATTLPKGLYAAGAVVIADVKYKYKPTFGSAVLAWAGTGGATYISMSNTSYMRPRNWTNYVTYPTQSGVGTGCTG